MDESSYVVTFERGSTVPLDGLRRMSLEEAREVLALAGRIPKRGRIVRVDTCEIVHEATS